METRTFVLQKRQENRVYHVLDSVSNPDLLLATRVGSEMIHFDLLDLRTPNSTSWSKSVDKFSYSFF
jgi:hypothetical protein